jgi:hypothetical protein
MLDHPKKDPHDTAKPSESTPTNPSENAPDTWLNSLAKRSTGLPPEAKPSPARPSEPKEKSPWAYAGLGIQFAGTVCLFAYAGYELDRWQGWHGGGLITLSLLAVVGNMYLLIKDSIKRQ